MVLENTIESPSENKGIKLVNLKGNQASIFSERTAVEAEAPIFWPPDVNSLEKTLMLGKIDGRRRRHERMRWLDGINDAMDMNLGKL